MGSLLHPAAFDSPGLPLAFGLEMHDAVCAQQRVDRSRDDDDVAFGRRHGREGSNAARRGWGEETAAALSLPGPRPRNAAQMRHPQYIKLMTPMIANQFPIGPLAMVPSCMTRGPLS